MLVNAKYAEQLLRRRKITAAARAAFTFPMEDILDPKTVNIVNEAAGEMSRGLRNWAQLRSVAGWLVEKGILNTPGTIRQRPAAP
jgi:hypothetical protein